MVYKIFEQIGSHRVIMETRCWWRVTFFTISRNFINIIVNTKIWTAVRKHVNTAWLPFFVTSRCQKHWTLRLGVTREFMLSRNLFYSIVIFFPSICHFMHHFEQTRRMWKSDIFSCQILALVWTGVKWCKHWFQYDPNHPPDSPCVIL